MVGSSLAPKWPIVVSFYGIHHQKSNFLLILAPFLPEAVEANRCYFFENWVKKLKCPHHLKPLGTIFQHNYWSFYTSEPFTLARFNMRHPVCILLQCTVTVPQYIVLTQVMSENSVIKGSMFELRSVTECKWWSPAMPQASANFFTIFQKF